MKNTFTALLLLWLGISGVHGQFSVHLDGGYALAAPGQQVGRYSIRTPSFIAVGNVYGSYGAGTQAGLRLGYHWNTLQGVELGAYYQQGQVEQLSQVDTAFEETTDHFSRQILLAPTLVFGRVDPGLRPFAKVGLLIPISTRMKEENVRTNDFSSQGGSITEVRQVYDYEISLALGATASLGLRYRKGLFSITAEAFWQSLNLTPVRRTTTSLTRDGQDISDQVPRLFLEQEYADEINTNQNGFSTNTDPDQPGFERIFTMPYSTYGLRLGVGVMIDP